MLGNEKGNSPEQAEVSEGPVSQGRRRFLGAVTSTPIAVGVIGLPPLLGASSVVHAEDELSPLSPEDRRREAARRRRRSLILSRDRELPAHPNNGDEENFPDFANNFTKGLPHNDLGLVDPAAYQQLRTALASGNPDDFGAIPMGCPDPALQRPLVDPQSSNAFDIEGPDAHQGFMPPAPAFDSAQAAAEMVEMYWAAATRDVPFSQYETNPLVALACNELSTLESFKGPKENGRVTPRSYIRVGVPGEMIGPNISQFLQLPVPYGAVQINDFVETYLPGIDFMTSYSEWLDIQRGCAPVRERPYDPVRRLIRSGRDISAYVNIDALAQAYFNALLIMATPPVFTPTAGMPAGRGGIGAPPDQNHPYRADARFRNQQPLGQMGDAWIISLMWEVASRAVKAMWFQKWGVHRRARPETYGGRVHNTLTGAADYPIHPQLMNSTVLEKAFTLHGTYLLPMAFPEGSPTHPAYGSGHACVAGACVTILKAFFDETTPITAPVMATVDGLSTVPYLGADRDQITVGGELNKLAANIAIARTHAGVHWRTDGIESMLLGERVAISLLQEFGSSYSYQFVNGFTLTKFSGEQILVGESF